MSRTIAALVVMLVACKDSGPKPPPKPTGTPLERMKAEMQQAPALLGPGFAVAPTPVPVTPLAPGAAYVFVKGVGLVVLATDGTAKLVPLPMTLVHLVIDKDGSIVALSTLHDMMRVRGETVEKVGAAPPGLQQVAFAPDGSLWIGDFANVHHFVNGAWETITPADLKNQVNSIDFDGKGRVYVTRFRDVSVLDGDVWQPVWNTSTLVEGEEDDKPYWARTVVSPAGELWMLSPKFLVRAVGGKPVISELPEPYFDSHGEGRFVGANFVAFGSMRDSFMTIGPAGTATVTKLKRPDRAGSFATAIDGRGRAWTWDPQTGLTIANPDGNATTFPNGSIPAINGDVESIVVAGTGPDKLPIVMEIARGTITGRVLDHDVPVANAQVEICHRPMTRFTTTPCDGTLDQLKGLTDADGAFKLEGPLQSYRIVAKIGTDWFTLFEKECSGLAAGAVCEIGVLDVKNKLLP